MQDRKCAWFQYYSLRSSGVEHSGFCQVLKLSDCRPEICDLASSLVESIRDEVREIVVAIQSFCAPAVFLHDDDIEIQNFGLMRRTRVNHQGYCLQDLVWPLFEGLRDVEHC